VHALTKKLACDLAARRVTVNCIAPGLVPTKMGSQLFVYKAREACAKGTPLGRLGNQKDMAGAALFLASPAASWVTGAILPVDGGALVLPSLL
jgi:NAD(P)-dependent dehydrogenase (short-subunit alcohol dehydrogenase family)